MDIKKVMDAGGFIHKNPAYNPKSKKNVVPRYITNDNPVGALNGASAAADFLMRHQEALQNLDYLGDPEKYGRYGVRVSPVGNLDSELAEAQSNWSKIGNSLAQTLVSEIGIGTLRGMSDLLDFVGQTVGVSSHDYSNPVSQYLEELQETFKNDVAPIYSDPERNTIADGGLGNVGWWASNLPSVASSLTLLLPSMGVTKGLSYLGNAKLFGKGRSIFGITGNAVRKAASGLEKAGMTKAASWLTKPTIREGANLAIENGLTAAMSRTMENYQESRQTYSDVYNEAKSTLDNMKDDQYQEFLSRNGFDLERAGIDVSNKDDVARYIAKQSADRTFAMDWANIVFDVYQMYSLRNIFKNAPKFIGNAATRKASRLSRLYPGLTAEEAAKEYAKRSAWERGWNKVGDYTIGFGRQVKASASEGVEEAINYIAQQEGTHLGKYLLTGEGKDDKSTGILDAYRNASTRIVQDYIQNSQLWDSAFWGVLGGVIFEAGGNYLNRVKQTLENKDEDREDKLKKPWWQLDNTTETQRMINEIQSRSIKFKQYQETVAAIKNGKNPYLETPEGQPEKELTESEKAIYLERAKNDYLTQLILDARNNGTLEDLRAYMRSPELRKAFVEQGLATEETADGLIADFDARSEKIENLYNSELTHFGYISSQISRRHGKGIPIEYLQIIASDNVRHRLNIETYDNWADSYQSLVTVEQGSDWVSKNLDPNINYQELVGIKMLAHKLSELEAKKKAIEEKLSKGKDILLEIEKEDVEKELEIITSRVARGEYNIPLTGLIYALQVSRNVRKNDEGKYVATDDAIVEQLDKLLSEGFEGVFDELGIAPARRLSTETVIGDLKRYMTDIKRIIGDNNDLDKLESSRPDLSKVRPELKDSYELIAALHLNVFDEESLIVESEDEVTNAINNIHNVSQEGRKAAIADATRKLFDLQERYKDINFIDLVSKNAQGINEPTIEALSEEDRQAFKEAMRVLNLGDRVNRGLLMSTVASLERKIINDAIAEAGRRAGEEIDSGGASESSVSQENPPQSPQNSDQANPPQEGQERGTDQENGQNEPSQSPKQRARISKNIDDGSLTIELTDDTGDDTIELSRHTNADPNDTSVRYDVSMPDSVAANNNDLYDHEGNNEVVIMKPIIEIDDDGKVVNIVKGVVRSKPAKPTKPAEISSTGGVQEESRRMPETGYDGPSESKQQAYDDAAVALQGTVNQTIMAYIKANKDKFFNNEEVSFSDIKAAVMTNEKVANSNLPASVIDELIRYCYRTIAGRVRAAGKDIANLKLDSPAANLIATLSASVEDYTSDKSKSRFKTIFNDNFKKALKELVEYYSKAVGLGKVDGKYLINFEGLLRYTNREVGDNFYARLLFNNLREYILSEDGQKEYIVVDENNLFAVTFLDNVAKTEQQRQEEIYRSDSQRVNIFGTIKELDAEDRPAYFDAFDVLEVGGTLTVDRSSEKRRIIFKHGNVVIGTITRPTHINNVYGTIANDWFYDLENVANSKFKTALQALVVDESEAGQELRELILTYAFARPSVTSDESRKLFERLANNEVFQRLKANHAITNANNAALLEGLASIWKYCADLAYVSNPSDYFKQSIDNWFVKLRASMDFAERLARSEQTEVTISEINDRQLLGIKNLNQIQSEEEIPVASEAIGKDIEGTVRLGINSSGRRAAGYIETSTGPGVESLVQSYSSTSGSVFVVVPVGNGVVRTAQARPMLWEDMTKHSSAAIKEILKAVDDSILQAIDKAATNDNGTELIALLDSLFASFEERTPLFFASYYKQRNNPTARYFAVGLKGNFVEGESINIFPGNPRSNNEDFRHPNLNYKGESYSFNNKEDLEIIKKLLLDRIHATARFNIGYQQITNDNGNRSSYSQVMHHDADGKFVVTIGTQKWTFDSFNDFIIANNAIRINMHPNSKGETISRSENDTFLERPRLKIADNTPVERIDNGLPVEHTVEKSRQEQVLDITEDESIENQGEAIANILFRALDKPKFRIKSLVARGLLPKKVIFDAFLTQIAQMTIGSDAVRIGSRFLENVSTDPGRAIRVLIHERLHQILHSDGNLEYRDRLADVYTEFLNKVNSIYEPYAFRNKYRKFADDNKKTILVDENVWTKEQYEEAYGAVIEDGNGNIINEALEEFLVESLTSAKLADYLNNTESSVKEKAHTSSKKKSLLNKIFDVLLKLLGIKEIKAGSLYAREYNTFLDFVRNIPEAKEVKPSTQEEIKETTQEQQETEESEADEYFDFDLDDELEDNAIIAGLDSSVDERDIDVPPTIPESIKSKPIEIQAAQARYIEQGVIEAYCR